MHINGECKNYENKFDMQDNNLQSEQSSIHYFRINDPTSSEWNKYSLHKSNRQTTFYRADGTMLTDISDVWRTGYGHCEPSGNLVPSYDPSIAVKCTY